MLCVFIYILQTGVDGDAPDDVIDEEDGKEELTDAKTIFTASTELVTPMNVTKGTLQITQTHLIFTSETNDGGKRDRVWHMGESYVQKLIIYHSPPSLASSCRYGLLTR
jgi:hypothetical protein